MNQDNYNFNEDIEKLYYTVKEVAEILQTSESTIRKYIRAGQLKAFRISPRSRWRIREDDLKALGKDEEK